MKKKDWISNRFWGLYKTIIRLYDLTKPHDRVETIVFVSTLIWFLTFSMFFAFSVDFSVKNELMGYDSFFYIGGDYPKLMLSKLFSWNLRHPLFVILLYPVIFIDALLPSCLHVAIYSFLSSVTMALTNLFIFKLCRYFSLDFYCSCFSVLLFPSIAHILLLSGQVETYVFTMFFLLLMILLVHKKSSDIYSDNVIFAAFTGFTITNCIYFFIIKTCEYAGNFKKAIINTLKSTWLFISLFGITLSGLAFRYFYKHIPLMEAILNDTHKFVHAPNNLITLGWRHYFCEPFLFHYTDKIVLTPNAEVLPDYPSIFYDAVVAVILGFTIWGICKSKPLLRNICLSMMTYNFIIHFVCGYGNNELQLFCGHWICFVPIFVAIGMNSIESLFIRRVAQIMIGGCVFFMAIHNGYCYFISINMCC